MPGDLIWEDETSTTPAWWLSRAGDGARRYFIARCPVTDWLLGVVRAAGIDDRVVAAVPPGAALEDVKRRMAEIAVTADPRGDGAVGTWRWRRRFALALRMTPLASAALLAGVAIGAAVALFAISTGLVGWPMAAVGVAFGAGAGPILKALAERGRPADNPWSRFLVATFFAALGAALAAGGLLVLFQG